MNIVNNNNNAGTVAITDGVIVDEYWVPDGRVVATRAHPVDEPEENMQRDIKLPWKLTIWAWVLLAIEVVVMGALYLNGGGRVAALVLKDGIDAPTSSSDTFDIEDYECFIGAGRPLLAVSVVLRAVAAVCTQLGVFCMSDRGLLKPFEAMWVIFASFMRCWGVPNMPWFTTYVGRDSYGRQVEATEFSGVAKCLATLAWLIFPVFVMMVFTGNVATFGIRADCELVLDDTVRFSVYVGYILFLMICFPLLSYLSDRKTEPIAPYARAFVVIDSITIGTSYVFGNYVQSGIVAGVFGLLPAFNLYLTYRECRPMVHGPSDAPPSTSPRITEYEA